MLFKSSADWYLQARRMGTLGLLQAGLLSCICAPFELLRWWQTFLWSSKTRQCHATLVYWYNSVTEVKMTAPFQKEWIIYRKISSSISLGEHVELCLGIYVFMWAYCFTASSWEGYNQSMRNARRPKQRCFLDLQKAFSQGKQALLYLGVTENVQSTQFIMDFMIFFFYQKDFHGYH